ncbi:MAG: DUF1295 domain-containing protein [Bacteroidetes bacterium]|nr:DUF1295 domain-containing protein [Bacteroidota bacterium]
MPDSIFFVGFILILLNQLLWFSIAWVRKDNGLADVGWGLGFILTALAGYYFNQEDPSLLLALSIILWGARLSTHIFMRNRLHQKEDWRYKAWREDWGDKAFQKSLTRVFLLQGFFLWIICLPVMVTSWQQASQWHWLHAVGLGVFLLGFIWETVGDYQLYQFKKDPANKGKLLTSGLWDLSRHPNYFGEILLWWGLFIYAIPAGYWWISILGPLTLNYLIVRVSGVAMMERKQKQHPGFADSAEKRPALIPKISRLFKSRTQ